MGGGWSQDKAPSPQSQPSEHFHNESQNNVQKIAGTQLSETKSKKLEKQADVNLPDTKPKVAEAVKLPHNYEAILREADSLPPTETIPMDKLHDQLYSGVFLNKKRKKYWVEKNSNANCFMLFARNLSITWADDNRYWHWPYLYETSDVYVDVAELLNVCWLEIHKKIDTTHLSPGVLYEVVFVMMLKDHADGWEAPLKLRLTLPNGIKQERNENLMTKPRSQWIEVTVGEFKTSPENTGEIEICIYEYTGQWKSGLVIKGVAIRPKN